MEQKIIDALANMGVCDGKVIATGDGTIAIQFGDIYTALNWVNMWGVHDNASLREPLRSLTHPVVIVLQVLRPALLGYENAGYTINSVIQHSRDNSLSDFHALATRPGREGTTEYAVWAGSACGEYEYTFYAGYYDAKTREEALANLRKRAFPQDEE